MERRRRVRRFVFDNFLAFMAALSLLMCWLSVAEIVPQKSWKDSPRFYGIMSLVFAVAAALIRPPKQAPFSDDELASRQAVRIAEVTDWLQKQVSWEELPACAEQHGEFSKNAERLMNSGAELWAYDSGSESWKSLGGERGYAIRHHNRVVDFLMVEES